jgi:hypothetical protein
MDNTVRRMAKILGAHGVEATAHDARFMVEGAGGGKLRLSLEGQQQRLMAVLSDATGQTCCTVDVAPVSRMTEDPSAPGRATIHIGHVQIHLDSQPTLAIEIVSNE